MFSAARMRCTQLLGGAVAVPFELLWDFLQYMFSFLEVSAHDLAVANGNRSVRLVLRCCCNAASVMLIVLAI